MSAKRKNRTPEASEGSKPKTRASARGRKPAEVSVRPETATAAGAKANALEVDWLEGGQGRINQKYVEDLTDRVFRSVLSRYGWMRDPEGHIEHVGAERR